MPAPAPYGTPVEQPRHPAFHKHRKRSEPQIGPERGRIWIGKNGRSLCLCTTYRCAELDGGRCAYYGDDLELYGTAYKRCDECVREKGR